MQPNKKPIISTESPIMGIYCCDEFNQLTQSEKEYCYRFSYASWEGAKICYFQKSYESPALFIILQLVFSPYQSGLTSLKEQALKVISEEEYKAILVYSAAFFNNCGNFKSFGDDKFIPNVSAETFYKFLQVSSGFESNKELIDNLWNLVNHPMYNFEGKYEKIGYPPQKGQTGYYSQNITKEEIDLVDEFLQSQNVETLNTRVLKYGDKIYHALVASVNQSKTTHKYKDATIELIYGDFSDFLKRVADSLEKGIASSSNEIQKNMLLKYVEHFKTGNIDTHKDSQRFWVKDIGPIVETNIGFIESYLDPKQVRAEWEGFASLVNKKQSAITQQFVEQAAQFLQMLPWPKEYEKDQFLKPDFTCLSILAFGSSGTPLGINIPNYDEIRQDEGFKNVYLSNCVPKLKPGQLLFLDQKDQDIQVKWFDQLMFHKVIFHELLGHGCGKLFQKTANGLNFDENTIDPLTGEKIKSYYGEKDTWRSVFQNLSAAYEECRADSVALYFSCFQESVIALQPEHKDSWRELCIAQYLNFIYAGLQGLEFYNTTDKKFGQAHINGRWVILQVLLEAGNNFVTIEKGKDSNGKDTVIVKVDHEQCFTTGKEAMKNFLLKLQVFKSTADFERANEMFGNYSKVNEKFMEIRQIVIDNKKPRRLEVQGHLSFDEQGKTFQYATFEESYEGIIQSYMQRYPNFDKYMLDLFMEHQKVNQPL